MNWITLSKFSWPTALSVLTVVYFLTFDQTFAVDNEEKKLPSSKGKVTIQFVEMDLMPRPKRQMKSSTPQPLQPRLNNGTKVFRWSKIRKKNARRYAKYRHSTRVHRGKPAIVLLPPFYRRPSIKNFTAQFQNYKSEMDQSENLEPMDIPTPPPEPLMMFSYPTPDTFHKGQSSDALSYPIQTPSHDVTRQTYSEYTSVTYNVTTAMPMFLEFGNERLAEPFPEFSFQNINNDSVININTNPDDIMYKQPPESPVQYLRPPIDLEYEYTSPNSGFQSNNIYQELHIKDPNMFNPPLVTNDLVTTQATVVAPATAYNELEVLKPPIYDDSNYWMQFQNYSPPLIEHTANDISSHGVVFNDLLNENMSEMYSDVNMSLLSSDVASMGMKVEATAKAIEMVRTVMQSQTAPSALGDMQLSRSDQANKANAELPLAVAESSHIRLPNAQFNQPTKNSYRQPQKKKKKPYKRPTDEVIPGIAGQDYPVYSTPPPPNQRSPCKEDFGYVPDPTSRCQVFYVCTGSGMGEPMLCPNGTLFSRDFLVCDWWYNVECLPN